MGGVLIDLDGVIYEGERAVAGAARAVARLREMATPLLFLTNTTSRPRRDLVEKLAGLGVESREAEILTPPVAAVRWLEANAPGPAALFVPEATAAEFEALPRLAPDAETGAASVVVGDLGPGWDFATLNRAFRLLMDEPRPALVALGMTRYWRAEDGLRLDVAAFVKALEHASGATAEVLGKPARAFFAAALDLLGSGAAGTVLVGDDIVSDVEGAQKAGLRGVLVRTGKFRDADLGRGIEPDAVLESFEAFPDWWIENENDTGG